MIAPVPIFLQDIDAMARLKSALAISAFALVLACPAYAEPGVRAVSHGHNHATTATSVELAQNFGVPPGNVGGGDNGGGDNGNGGGDNGGGGDATLVVRVSQLEAQVRDLNGKIEQLQYANHQLEDQMKKFQEDVEFRFQELSHRGGAKLQKHSDLSDNPASMNSADQGTTGTTTGSTTASQIVPAPHGDTHDDVFDPTKDPNAPGAPHNLSNPSSSNGSNAANDGAAGNGAPNGQVASNDDGPINLLSAPQSGQTPGGADAQPNPATTTTGGVPQPGANPGPGGYTTPGGTVIADAAHGADETKEEFDIALAYMKQKDYDNAERSLSDFLDKNPKNKRTSDAIYYLGESYYARGRNREAAEQYLKISANYASSPRAPDAMLRLGQALHALGDKEQACAAFSEVPRRYPNAAATVKASAAREAKKAQC
jgi:tol-pal system protein YbgF